MHALAGWLTMHSHPWLSSLSITLLFVSASARSVHAQAHGPQQEGQGQQVQVRGAVRCVWVCVQLAGPLLQRGNMTSSRDKQAL